jgi:hypothetical protein
VLVLLVSYLTFGNASSCRRIYPAGSRFNSSNFDPSVWTTSLKLYILVAFCFSTNTRMFVTSWNANLFNYVRHFGVGVPSLWLWTTKLRALLWIWTKLYSASTEPPAMSWSLNSCGVPMWTSCLQCLVGCQSKGQVDLATSHSLWLVRRDCQTRYQTSMRILYFGRTVSWCVLIVNTNMSLTRKWRWMGVINGKRIWAIVSLCWLAVLPQFVLARLIYVSLHSAGN